MLRIHTKDNVIVALTDLSKGDVISYEGNEYVLKTDVPAKHKFVVTDLNEGDLIYMYGVLVGATTQPIGRMAKPEEIGNLALYLVCDEASFITGTDYPIDGGFIKLNGK